MAGGLSACMFRFILLRFHQYWTGKGQGKARGPVRNTPYSRLYSRTEERMKVLVTRVMVALVASSLVVSPVFAQEDEQAGEVQKTEETEEAEEQYEKIKTGNHWLLGQVYYTGDKRIGRGKVKSLVYAIDDDEAAGHLRKSEICFGGGIATFVVGLGLILSSIPPEKEKDFNKAMLWPGIGLLGATMFFANQSNEELVRGIERYNEALEEKYGISLHLFPQSGKTTFLLTYSF